MLALPFGLILLSYFIGSIPFSYLIARMVGKTDLRRVGSGNVGATNVLRSVGKTAGVLALLLDALKGMTVVWIATRVVQEGAWPWVDHAGSVLGSPSFWIGFSALAAVLGHMFPVWLRFKGGKGVATGAGVFLAIEPLAVAASAIVFLIVAILSRYISLGSIAAAASLPLFLRFLTGAPFWTLIVSIIIAVLIILKHRENIARLVKGDEHRFPH